MLHESNGDKFLIVTSLPVVTADTWKKKTVGLIGSKTAYPLLLKTRFGIHTFGVLFPIDVLVLSKDGNVVALKEKLVPYRVFFWNPHHSIVIELPNGYIKEKKIKIGDAVKLEIREIKKESLYGDGD